MLLRYFRNPCDGDHPTGNFKNFRDSSQEFPKILNVYFGGKNVYFWGYLTFTFGERTFTFGEYWGFRGFGFFFVAGGFWDSVGRGGGARKGFRKYLSHYKRGKH